MDPAWSGGERGGGGGGVVLIELWSWFRVQPLTKLGTRYLTTKLLSLEYYPLYISKHSDILLRLQLSKFILPVVHGFIEIHNCSINKKSFDFILISRRSCYRAGMAWFIVNILLPQILSNRGWTTVELQGGVYPTLEKSSTTLENCLTIHFLLFE